MLPLTFLFHVFDHGPLSLHHCHNGPRGAVQDDPSHHFRDSSITEANQKCSAYRRCVSVTWLLRVSAPKCASMSAALLCLLVSAMHPFCRTWAIWYGRHLRQSLHDLLARLFDESVSNLASASLRMSSSPRFHCTLLLNLQDGHLHFLPHRAITQERTSVV